jgi:hypothetical protein
VGSHEDSVEAPVIEISVGEEHFISSPDSSSLISLVGKINSNGSLGSLSLGESERNPKLASCGEAHWQ